MNPPMPSCKAFLVCKRIVERGGDTILFGLPIKFSARFFPAGLPLGVFARLTSGHGDYQAQVQLINAEGEVVWREGPAEPWPMDDPLRLYDLTFNLNVVFPKPGQYDIVLFLNGEEVARHAFWANLAR